MEQQLQNDQAELELSLGNVANSRAQFYGLLRRFIEGPTIELAESLLHGNFVSEVESNVRWVNSRSGIFNDSLASLKRFADYKHENVEQLFESLQEEYERLFLAEDGCKLSFLENDYVKTAPKATIEEIYLENDYDSYYKNLSCDHLCNELKFLEFLCTKEGESWQKGRIPKAKLWRRKEREFTVNHLGKWGEQFL